MGWARWARVAGIIGGTVMLHELAHALAARRAGGEVREVGVGFGPPLLRRKVGGVDVTLRPLPLGGFAAIDVDRLPPARRVPVLLAGPLANIAAGLLLRQAARVPAPVLLPGQTARMQVGGLLSVLALLNSADGGGPRSLAAAAGALNLSVGISNLLPLLPLDGGHLAVARMEAAGFRPGAVSLFRGFSAALFGYLAVWTLVADLARIRQAPPPCPKRG
ncbi:MAG: site-2 protease family protein [bacterium]|nr:site-2 protease family protein [bacterium]